jgi:DtxR family Mn-dependent transcriptional regulator
MLPYQQLILQKGVSYMHLQESGEMYLETILILSRKTPSVRAIDVGEYMGYTKPSVSRALGLLKTGGYVVTDSDGYLTLTEAGKEIAEKIYGRHALLTEFLVHLGVDQAIAAKDACKIEHDISDETFEAIKKYARHHE